MRSTYKRTRAEADRMAREDLDRAVTQLLKLKEKGPLTPAQAAQLARLRLEARR